MILLAWYNNLDWLFFRFVTMHAFDSSPVCKGGNRANWSKSMKFGTPVLFNMLYPNLPGAKANFQWCRHIGRFEMAARQKLISFLFSQWKVVELQIDTLFGFFYHKESESGIFTVVLIEMA